MVLKVLIGVLIVVAAFVVWRYTSVARGANASDEALLKRIDPLAQRIEAKESVGPAVLHQVAAAPELRPMLYLMLSHYQRADLFPSQFMTQQAQAESALVYWMIHPGMSRRLLKISSGSSDDYATWRSSSAVASPS